MIVAENIRDFIGDTCEMMQWNFIVIKRPKELHSSEKKTKQKKNNKKQKQGLT